MINLSEALVIAKDDFNIVSGTSADQRGQVSNTTATESKILEARTSIRESAEQLDFAEAISRIGRELLVQAGEKMAIGLWIRLNNDPQEDVLTEIQNNGPAYKYITSQHIEDGYDFDIDIDVVDAIPQQMQAEKAKFIEFLSLTTQFPQINLSPVLIREAAYRVGYRNEKIIQQMQKAALLQMMGQASQGAQNTGQDLSQVMANAGGGNNMAKAQVAQNNPNTGEQINQQIQQQLQ